MIFTFQNASGGIQCQCKARYSDIQNKQRPFTGKSERRKCCYHEGAYQIAIGAGNKPGCLSSRKDEESLRNKKFCVFCVFAGEIGHPGR